MKTDSLKKHFKDIKNDSTKIISLIYVSINEEDFSKKNEFLSEAKKLSEKLNWTYGYAFFRIFYYKYLLIDFERNNKISINEKNKKIKEFNEFAKSTEQILIKNKFHNLLKIFYFEIGVNNYRIDDNLFNSIEYLEKSLKTKIDKHDKVNLLIEESLNTQIYEKLGEYYQAVEKFDTAIQKFKEGVKYCNNYYKYETPQKENLRNSYARILYYLGNLYRFTADYQNAIKSFQESYKLMILANDKAGAGRCLMNIGNIFRNIGNYSSAVENYLKALNHYGATEVPDKASAYLNIGNIYQLQGDYKNALNNYNNSLELIKNTDYLNLISGTFNSIGNAYLLSNQLNKAFDYFTKSLKINKKHNFKSGLAANFNSFGSYYLSKKDYEQAKNYFDSSLVLYYELGMKSNLAVVISKKSNLYNESITSSIKSKDEKLLNFIKRNNISIDDAIELQIKSLELQKEIGELAPQLNTIKSLSTLFYSIGKYKESADYLRDYEKIKDSIFTIDSKIKISELLAIRENEIKDKEIKVLQAEKKSQQFQYYLLISGLIFLITAFVIALVRFFEKKKLSEQLLHQKQEIENQKLLVDEKNQQILDSINYAATIQNAILPRRNTIEKYFEKHFIIYKPKDIVSGDSYWFKEIDGIIFLAVIDCTGHGVPGSMLTVIANSVLDEAVLSRKLKDTSEILNFMNEKVTEVLNQRLAENSIRDGMEVALIAIHQDKIQFSGAGRPLYLKNEKIEIIKTDKRGIAGQTNNDYYQFSSIEIEKSENLMLYLTSDGFPDQMNENSKKYSTKRFMATLDKISEMQLDKQKEILENEFNSHKGNREQIDDVTVIGVRL